MELKQAILERHSVHKYLDKELEPETARELILLISELNSTSGLHMQLIQNEPKAFSPTFLNRLVHYDSFQNVKNYIILAGPKSDELLEEKCGYYGEHIVLWAQQQGLRTGWAAGTYRLIPNGFTLKDGDRFVAVIAIGYGAEDGRPHSSKSMAEVTGQGSGYPDWFRDGVSAALLAPTALNQQKFRIYLSGDQVYMKASFGPYTQVDLGIVEYHFEIGSGKKVFPG